MTAPAVDPLLGISDVERATGLERTTIWRRCRAGTFLAPVYIANRRFWRASEIAEWLRQETARQATSRRGARNLLGAAGAEQ